MASVVLDFVSDVAGSVASRIPPRVVPSASGELFQNHGSRRERRQRHVPRGLDMHYITDRIIGMAQPAEALFPEREDQGRDPERTRASDAAEPMLRQNHAGRGDSTTNKNDPSGDLPPSQHQENLSIPSHQEPALQSQSSTEDKNSIVAVPMSLQIESHSQLPQPELQQENRLISRREGNCPATLSTFLSRWHPNQFLAVNVSDQEADDRTLLLLNRQIVRFPWMSPCVDKSETPSIAQLFEICYAIQAYLSLGDDRVVLVYCKNGKTRTAIVMACYLKFSGQVRSALDGFRLFCRRRCPDLDSSKITEQIPPSLKTFFRNFSDCVDLAGFANPKPLLLRAVALQGVPVDDKPCVDIWDSQQRRVYSSHPELWRDPAVESEGQGEQPADTQWGDEEGFYRVNKVLASDFVVLCRFGGPYADDSNDPSKILFRYANSTGFLCSGPYELPKGKVDMMRRYETSFDEEDFLLTLMFDSSLDTVASEEYQELCHRCPESLLPRILEGPEALERGFSIIAERHAARPTTKDVEILTSGEGLVDCDETISRLSLQLNNHNMMAAQQHLRGEMSEMWVKKVNKGATLKSDAEASNETEQLQLTDIPELTPEDACANVFQILDEVDADMDVDMEWIDRVEGDLVDDWETRVQKSKSRGHQMPEGAHSVAVYNPILTPSRGDVVDAFGSYNKQLNLVERDESLQQGRNPLSFGARPRMPMNSGRKRQRPGEDGSSLGIKRRLPGFTKHYGSVHERHDSAEHDVGTYSGDIVYDDDTASAMELLLMLSHTGITLADLKSLQTASKGWTGEKFKGHHDHQTEDEKMKAKQSSAHDSDQVSTNIASNTSVIEAVGEAVASDNAAIHVLVRQREPVPGLRTAPSDTTLSAQDRAMQGLEVVVERQDAGPNNGGKASAADAAARDVIQRLKQSLPGIPVKMTSEIPPPEPPPKRKDLSAKLRSQDENHDAQSTGKGPESPKEKGDSSISPEDTGRSSEKVEHETEEKSEGEKDEVKPRENLPLKDDPEYAKYFKMLKMSLPMAAVKHALQRDSKDPAIIDLDPEKSLKSQLKDEEKADEKSNGEVSLREDPEYSKYFKMLKMGLPEGAVRNALQRDGKDPGIMDLDPDKSLNSQQGEGDAAESGPSLKDDPEYAKYFKMLKMGLPDGAVRNALQRDGKDPGILDLDPNQPLKSQIGEGDKTDDGPPLRADPEYSKYYRMLKMGLPEGAVRNALERDGKDPRIMDLDPEKSLKCQMGAEANEDDGPPIKDDPEFSKYFKMLKMMLPMGAVKQAMQRDGKDPSIMDLDHSMSLKSQNAAKDEGPPLKDDPEFSKYFKMLKMGLPMGAVKNALQRDGKDTAVMDLDPSKSVASQMSSGKRRKLSKKAKKAVRRKKIYWTPIDPVKVHQDSIWSLVRGTVNMDELKYDTTEFENLFTESSDPAEKKKKSRSGGEQSMKPKKSIQVIDGKRGMNGGIILARLKIEYEKLADMVDRMESDKLDATQLRALKEFLPSDEERSALRQYMKKGEASEQALVEAKAALSECEKYMVAMMKVENADAKFDCMLFKSQFNSRLDELIVARDTVKKACDEVRSSERLRKIFAMILTLVNQINTGGSGKMAVGFSLDALLKLNEAKAFDKKTSVLHYLAKLVLQNDQSLLEFNEDIKSVSAAENVILDTLATDMKVLSEELNSVHETAKNEADRWEGTAPEKRTELQRERSASPPTGRTPMESFTLRADMAVKDAVSSVGDLKASYTKLLEYFGEDEKMPSNEFFGTITKFVAEFSLAAEQVEKAEKKKLKEKLRAAAKAAMLASRMSSNKSKVAAIAKKEEKRHPGSPKPGNTTTAPAPPEQGAPGVLGQVRSGPSSLLEGSTTAEVRSRRSSETDKGKALPPVTGIAAAAAAAARKRDADERKLVGGIAAAAAAAAGKAISRKLTSPNPDKGTRTLDLPALSNDAALDEKGSHGRERYEKDFIGPEATGVAASTAAAVVRERENEKHGLIAGVAAAAAAAAGERCGTEVSPLNKNEGLPATTGIAAAAAAAARSRMTKPDDEKEVFGAAPGAGSVGSEGKQDSIKNEGHSVTAGNAVVKTAASRTSRCGNNDHEEPVTSTAPATQDSSTGEAESSHHHDGTDTPSAGNAEPTFQVSENAEPDKSVAQVPTATTKTLTKSCEDRTDEVPAPNTGIAATAAAAALNRGENSINVNLSVGRKDSEGFEAAGVAVAGAAIATGDDSVPGDKDITETLAAVTKSQLKDHEKASQACSRPVATGIAAAAAAAARTREDDRNSRMTGALALDAGSIAVKGATSAADRTPSTIPSSCPEDDQSRASPGGGQTEILTDPSPVTTTNLAEGGEEFTSGEKPEDKHLPPRQDEDEDRHNHTISVARSNSKNCPSLGTQISRNDGAASPIAASLTVASSTASEPPESSNSSQYEAPATVALSTSHQLEGPAGGAAAETGVARRNEAAKASSAALATSRFLDEKSFDAASLATAARRNEAAAAAASASQATSEKSSIDVAGLAAAARQDEALAAASAALARSDFINQSSKDAAAEAAASRQNEAAAAVAAALAAAREQQELPNKATAAATARKNDAASSIAAALAAARQEREASQNSSEPATSRGQNDAAAAVAAALAASRKERETSTAANKVGGKARQKDAAAIIADSLSLSRKQREVSTAHGGEDVFNASDVSTFDSASPLSFTHEQMGSPKFCSVKSEAAQKIDVALSKRRIAAAEKDIDTQRDSEARAIPTAARGSEIGSVHAQALSSSQETRSSNRFSDKPNQRIWSKPSDVKASAEGTSSRVDATSLLWDNDSYENDLNAILWDNAAAESKTEGRAELENDTKQWFRDAMAKAVEEDSE